MISKLEGNYLVRVYELKECGCRPSDKRLPLLFKRCDVKLILVPRFFDEEQTYFKDYEIHLTLGGIWGGDVLSDYFSLEIWPPIQLEEHDASPPNYGYVLLRHIAYGENTFEPHSPQCPDHVRDYLPDIEGTVHLLVKLTDVEEGVSPTQKELEGVTDD